MAKFIPQRPKNTTLLIILLTVFAVGLGIFKFNLKPYQLNSFDECVGLRGSKIQKSYPAVCVTTDGQRFIQSIDSANSPDPTPTPPDVHISPTLINQLTGWQIFSYESFMIETPPNWTATQQNSNYTFSYTSISDGRKEKPDSYRIQINVVDTNQDLDQYVGEQEKIGKKIGGSDFQWLSSPATLNDQPASRITTAVPGFLIFSKNPSKNQIIEMVFLNDFSKNNLLASQILKSFRFISSSCPVSCSEEIYQNTPCSTNTYITTNLDSCSCPQEVSCQQSHQATSSANLKSCIISGCNNDICSDSKVIVDCVEDEGESCYQEASCEHQADNQCGWTQTEELTQCLEQKSLEDKDQPQL